MRDLKIAIEHWPVAGEFRIANSALKEITVVTTTIQQGAHIGRGECRPYAKYDETADSVVSQIKMIKTDIENGLDTNGLQKRLPAGAARNAIDCALWDLKAKQSGRSIPDLLGTPAPSPRLTAFTLSIDSPPQIRKAAIRAKAYPILKVKIDGMEGLASCLAVMDARPDAQLIIDANEALQPADILEFQSALEGKPVIMIEQPLSRSNFGDIPNRPNTLPIFCADESLHVAADLDRLWESGYRAVNVKLDKCGGLTEGLELMRAAKAKGFIIMAGCMVGTSLAMAPMMVLESFADYIDLDGALLLAKDRKHGVTYQGPYIHPPKAELWG